MKIKSTYISQTSLFLLIFAALGIFPLIFTTPLQAEPSPSGIQVVAFHAQRYHDVMANRLMCEVFGEVKNVSDRPLKRITVQFSFLDQGGKVVATEELELVFRVIVPRNARGEARSVQPQEFGNFGQDTASCPDQWLEGRIKYEIKHADWE